MPTHEGACSWRREHGEKWQMQVWTQEAGTDAKYEMDMTPSDTIQKTMNAKEMTSQKLQDTISNTTAC